VERAAHAAVFQPAECQVCATMRAIAIDQAKAPVFVAKQHQVLAQHFDCLERAFAFQFLRDGHGLPILPQQVAQRRGRAGKGDELVLFGRHGEASCWNAPHLPRMVRRRCCPFGSAALRDVPRLGNACRLRRDTRIG
jgi:hypothetical protein